MNMVERLISARKPRRYLCPFDRAESVELVGGKGQSLQQLQSIGAPVPEGLILTTHFCRDALDRPHVFSVKCRETLDEVQNTFGRGMLIVRSSAVGEDGQTAAFAGLLESIFPVDPTDRGALEDAVWRCISSFRAPRVVAYEKARGVRLGGMAIVVQRLIHSVAAGVLFTDGVTLRGEWCQGYGQTLVDGLITPGAFRLDRRVGRPAFVERPSADGSAFPLDERACATLVQYATTLERRRGMALDIEWAVDDSGQVWFVQARPVTHRRTYLFSNANISENFPTPVVPLLASFARAGYDAYFRNLAREFGLSERRIRDNDAAFRGIIDVHGARLYYNLTHIHTVLRLMPFGDALVDSFDTFVGAGASQANGVEIQDELFALGRVVGHVARAYRDLPARIARFEHAVNAVASQFHPRRIATMSLGELANGLQSILDIRLHRWIDASLADCAAAVTYRALQALLRHQKGEDPGRHHVLLEGLDVAGAWSLRALWALARTLSADGQAREALEKACAPSHGGFAIFYDALDAEARVQVDEWLDRYGFRGSGELLLTEPSLAEKPDRLLPLLQRYVQAALDVDERSPDAGFEQQKALRERMTARYRAGYPPYLRPVFDWLVVATQSSVKFRERARFRQALLYSRLRSIALACGQQFATNGTLENVDDVFFLTFDELSSLASNGFSPGDSPRERTARRRTEHAVQSKFDLPDVFMQPTDHCVTERDLLAGFVATPGIRQDGALVGVPASAGRVEGRAAVLDGLAEANRLEKGDILVARQTDPGWAPLFFLVRGLVLERGGMLSHGSILARELGIPSVVGVENATARITHGCHIVVDGDAGHVQCL